MSMTMLTVLQIMAIFAAYLSVTLALPWLFFRKRLTAFPLAARFMAYLLIGNFYIINLVYLLQLLHLSSRLTLTAGTLAPFAVIALKHREKILICLEQGLKQMMLIFGGEQGKKTLVLKVAGKVRKLVGTGKWKQRTAADWLDILLTAGVVGLVFYMYGMNAFRTYGYCASDMVTHNYWINEMGENNIFAAGIYPFGMHCVIYYLHTVFAIPTYVLMRLFWLVQTLLLHLVLLVFLKLVCKSRYAAYTGVMVFLLSDLFYEGVYYRYYAALPQEFGMIFILPAAYFIIAFFQERTQWTRAEGKGGLNPYLVFFAMGVALTFTAHFYDTMILGLFCIGIAAGFCYRCFRWRYLKRVLAAGFMGLLIAALPMVIGYIAGKPLQGSLNWGMSVITDGTKNAGEAGADGADADDSSEEGRKTEIQPRTAGVLGKLRKIPAQISYALRTHITAGNKTGKDIVLCVIGIYFLLGILCCILRRTDYGSVLTAIGIFIILLTCLLASANIGIPQLMDVTRSSIYYVYFLGLVWSLAADSLVYLLFREKKAIDFGALAVLAACCGTLLVTGIRHPLPVKGYELNGAIACLTNIIRENADGKWTICSANDERQMVLNQGYHYETIEFLTRMESLEEDTSITIPTSMVYFFIEKIPTEYPEDISTTEPNEQISAEKAKSSLDKSKSLNAYKGDARLVVMSRMYYWAQAFAELFPNEMEVYYESDDFICYRVRQNEYSLYNFAIDYGYNGARADE